MNILINYPNNGESGPAFSLELAIGMQELGHKVYAVLNEGIVNEAQWKEKIAEENLYWIKRHQKGSKFSFIISTLRFIIVDCVKIRRKFSVNFDLSIRTFYSHWAPFVDKSIKAKKIVSFCHDPKPHSGASRNEKLYYHFYHSSDAVIVLTKSFLDETHKTYDIPIERIHYVPHGRMNMYSKNAGYDLVVANYKHTYHFLFFGRIEKYKGLHVLAEAYRILLEKTKDVDLTILGSGNFEEYQDEYLSLSNVHIINRYIKDEEVGNYFSLPNTIAVVPYIDATQSGVIPIAYEFGTPIIASDTGGLKEQLNDGKLGLLYQNNDAEQLAECMLQVINNPEIFKTQKFLMENYRKKLDWSVVAQKLLDALKGEI